MVAVMLNATNYIIHPRPNIAVDIVAIATIAKKLSFTSYLEISRTRSENLVGKSRHASAVGCRHVMLTSTTLDANIGYNRHLNLYCIKGALALFVLVSFSVYTCAR